MGARVIKQIITTTKTLREAFNDLKQELREEYGNDPYNGTLSTCSLLRAFGNDEKYSKTKENKIVSNISETKICKNEAYGYSLGVTEYEILKVDLQKIKCKSKSIKPYSVAFLSFEYGLQYKNIVDLQKAEEFAIEKALEGYRNVSIMFGTQTIAKINVERKISKTKPKTTKNTFCNPIYKYLFIGKVSE